VRLSFARIVKGDPVGRFGEFLLRLQSWTHQDSLLCPRGTFRPHNRMLRSKPSTSRQNLHSVIASTGWRSSVPGIRTFLRECISHCCTLVSPSRRAPGGEAATDTYTDQTQLGSCALYLRLSTDFVRIHEARAPARVDRRFWLSPLLGQVKLGRRSTCFAARIGTPVQSSGRSSLQGIASALPLYRSAYER
jgi:hypothetical protein